MKRILTTLKEKWPEYLLEILVLIAGIYGAFAVDNWNESRKSEEQFRTILSLVKSDILSDIQEFDSARIEYDIRLANIKSMYLNTISKEEYMKSNTYFISILGYEDIWVDRRGIELLNQKTDLEDKDQLKITNRINSFYSDRIHEIEISEKELAETLEHYRSSWSTMEWWFAGIMQRDHLPFANYIWENEAMRRDLFVYGRKFYGFRNDWMIYKEEGLKLISEINDYLSQ